MIFMSSVVLIKRVYKTSKLLHFIYNNVAAAVTITTVHPATVSGKSRSKSFMIIETY